MQTTTAAVVECGKWWLLLGAAVGVAMAMAIVEFSPDMRGWFLCGFVVVVVVVVCGYSYGQDGRSQRRIKDEMSGQLRGCE